ncbi:hypothetical protein V6N13_008327 [Hibiscus sabdariffa]|uniref:Uncharacterized protein n=1 Tax=Hibiscus sabdariffa TaxID=183260 RepID=A0ABR2EGC9_9ROSI
MVLAGLVVDGISVWVGDAGRSNGEEWWRLGYGKWIGGEKKDGCCAAREWSMGLLEMGKFEAQVVGMERLARWVEGSGSRAMLELFITNGDGGKSMMMMMKDGIEKNQTWFFSQVTRMILLKKFRLKKNS